MSVQEAKNWLEDYTKIRIAGSGGWLEWVEKESACQSAEGVHGGPRPTHFTPPHSTMVNPQIKSTLLPSRHVLNRADVADRLGVGGSSRRERDGF